VVGVVREPRRPLDDETPTEAIPVQEILSRLRAERVASSGAARSAVASRRPGMASSGAVPPGVEPSIEPRSPAHRRRSAAAPAAAPGPAAAAPAPASAGPLFGSEDDRPAAGGPAARAAQAPRDAPDLTAKGAAGITPASTLWLLAGIVVLFAAAVVLLAVTVRSLCLDPSVTEAPPSTSVAAAAR
jgi:hypothetical protein